MKGLGATPKMSSIFVRLEGGVGRCFRTFERPLLRFLRKERSRIVHVSIRDAVQTRMAGR